MLKMSDDDHTVPTSKEKLLSSSPATLEPRVKSRALSWFKGLVRSKDPSNSNEQLQEALEDYIEELKDADPDDIFIDNQKELLTNVLNTRDLRVADVMIPRADIVAIEQNASHDDLKKLFTERQFSRLPVYAENLDHIVGTLHIKDILNCLLENHDCNIAQIAREAMVVHSGLPVMDLFRMMREDKKHMAMVTDEHGGIDGLVTLNDVIEAIMGDIADEFDHEEPPQIIEKPDGSVIADARMDIEEFEERFGRFLSPDEREDIETLGGLAFHIAGHVPKRGEHLKHASGVALDVLDADQSKVTRVRVRHLPVRDSGDEV